ncbi:BAHD acyltransferase, partial [Nymphaea thermarum]
EFTVSKAAGVCISDLVSDVVSETINSFSPLVGAISYDGHYRPLLAVQVTKVVDGVVIGCLMNRVIGDDGSFWHFVESWSELSARAKTITRPPVTERPPIHKEVGRIWFTASEKNMDRTLPPPFKQSCGSVSSLQAITALLWRSMMRAKNLSTELITLCVMNVGCRSRLEPPLPEEYFGNCVQPLMVHAKVGELLGHDLGWAGRALHCGIAAQTPDAVRNRAKGWVKMPYTYGNSRPVPNIIVVGGSPREDIFGIDFGWGTGFAVLSGPGSKFDGRIAAFPGKCGSGSIDLQVCLAPQYLSSLESDEELLDALNAT